MVKKWIIAITALVALTGLVLSGCSSEVKANTDPAQVINTGVNQEFSIALGSNMTTGYGWQPEYDKSILDLVNKDYKANDTTGRQLVGAGGTEYFQFKALKSGETKINFTYYRPWETPKADDKKVSFTVKVK